MKRDYELELPLDMLSDLAANPATMALPDADLANYWTLRKNRIIWLDGGIDTYALSIVQAIQIWNIEDKGKPVEERTPIKLCIFSGGGADSVAWAIVDAIKASKTPVWTVNMNLAMSNGLTLLVAGHKRFAMEHSSAMYHSGSAELSGTKEQLDAATKWTKDGDKQYNEWLLANTAIDSKLFKRKQKMDWYMNGPDQIQYGVVDAIIKDLDEIL